MKQREQEKIRKASTLLERTTRRRTKFDFDLWQPSNSVAAGGCSSTNSKVVDAEIIENDEWLEKSTKSHTFKNTRQIKRKPPKDLFTKPSSLSAVEVPHSGTSYNPR